MPQPAGNAGRPMVVHTDFGTELRRRRKAAGLSLSALADLVTYDKSSLSRVESGARLPSRQLAAACDAELGAGGELLRLAGERARRDSGSSPGPARVHGSVPPPDDVVATFASVFGQLRRIGQQVPPPVVLGQAAEQVRALRSLVVPDAPESAPVLLLAARTAEFTGWMAQEAGDVPLARRWTAEAVRLAALAGDESMAAHAHVRRAGLALYQREGLQVVALARRAQATAPVGSRVHAQAAQREAQGHALLGDAYAVERLLDGPAVTPAASSGPFSGGLALGSTTVPDMDDAVAGWCFHDLGQHARAVDALTPVVAGLPPWAARAKGRFGARLARAQLGAGDLDAACATGLLVLSAAGPVASATIAAELRQLLAELGAWRRRHPPAGELNAALGDLLG
ncbi:helix-turn-helix domain-containing protein [Actinomadura rayongensis]|uniref:Helix-turn-helix domain-containing protein n=1 Tax=Actinomadura rayongensis TaxID=1429076 RepID=A0A6I4WFG3_9ACTN|nr:helix-turn-helix transcriptional regulator [Actinomadura rayongensis]MXQ65684.1 helix-turn-helix domain-containing protein [Actinomadura rayongensis]